MVTHPAFSLVRRVLAVTALPAVVALLAAVTAGCSSGSTYSSGSSGQKAARTTFTYATASDVVTEWDPAVSYSNEIIAMSNIYETLTRYDDRTQQVTPLLATRWSSRDGGRTWEFTLRSGVTFHTGRPMTAQAARAAILRTKKLAGGAAYIWDAVSGIDTPDDHTLVFHLSYPAPLDLISSADYGAYVYDTQATGEGAAPQSFTATDAGTGPYTVEAWHKGQETELTLKRYPQYWHGWQGRHFTRLAFRVVPKESTAVQLLRDGQVDFVAQPGPQLWKSLSGDKRFRVTSASGWQNLFGLLNTQKGALKDVRVRQAIAYALDYDGMIGALQGSGVKASGIIPRGLLGYATDLPVYGHDPGRAKQLLAQAGYGPGGKKLSLELTYTTGEPTETTVATLIKSNLAPLNVDVTVRPLPWESQQWPKAKSANPATRQDILLMFWWPDYASPYSWFISMFHTEKQPQFNLAYYSNPALDKLIDSVEQISAVDRTRAVQTYRQMQQMILADAPALLLGTQNYLRAMRADFDGYVDNPAYPNVVFGYELTPR